jgi:C-terminal processing protease CtpA/Prc
MPVARFPALAILAAAIAGCSSGPKSACDPASEKASVAATVRDWYLFPELLPAAVDPAAYDTPAALLDALTQAARDQGKDRHWSYLTTVTQTQQYYGAGQSVGFGIVALARGSQLFLGDVIGGSAAAAADFARGDEILGIGEVGQALVPVADLIATGTLSDAYGPSDTGVTRVFAVKTQAGATEQRTVTKRVYSLDPVPAAIVVPRAGMAPAGYLSLRTFIGTADAPLRQAFADFQAAGVSDVVVDLRYNGGGLLSLAELLADLLGGAQAGKPMYTLQLNASHAASSAASSFAAVAGAVSPGRIAFITTGATASASELVLNVLDPYVSVALVGDRTYGKPVGQLPFQDQACDLALFLIAFRLANSAGHADYYGGLPDTGFNGPLCPAADDVTQPRESPLEASTAAALSWLESGTCPLAPVAARAIPPSVFPRPSRPTPAQLDIPGLF